MNKCDQHVFVFLVVTMVIETTRVPVCPCLDVNSRRYSYVTPTKSSAVWLTGVLPVILKLFIVLMCHVKQK